MTTIKKLFHKLKTITIIGDADVGKTSLLLRMVGENVNIVGKSITIGVDFKQRIILLPDGRNLVLCFWDTVRI